MKHNSLRHDDQTGRSYRAWDYVTLCDPTGDTCPALRRNVFVVSLKALTNGIAFRSENLRWFSSNQIYCTHGNSFCLGKLSVCCTKSTLSLPPVLSTPRPLAFTTTSHPALSKLSTVNLLTAYKMAKNNNNKDFRLLGIQGRNHRSYVFITHPTLEPVTGRSVRILPCKTITFKKSIREVIIELI